jgi:hypothetical protein
MHDYTAKILHDDRMRTLRREAAEARLAAGPRRDGWFRQTLAGISGWARRDALAHGLGGSLRPTTHPQLSEDA